jgi:hypothetical protein
MEESKGIISTDSSAIVDASVEAKNAAINASLEAQDSKGKADKTEKVEDAKVEDKKDDKFAAKFAALNRREKALKATEKRLSELEKKLNVKPEVKEEVKAPVVPFEKRLKQDLFGTLKEAGFDLDTIVNIALNDGKLPQDMQLKLMREDIESGYKSELQQIKDELAKEREEKEKQKLSQDEKQVEETITNFKKDIGKFVKEKNEDYELIQSEDAVDLVYDVITQHWNETKDPETGLGEFLEIKDAADLVENHLLEEAKKRLNLSKIKKLTGANPGNEPKSEPKKASITLSNTQSQSVTGNEKRAISNEESLATAAKLLRWQE